MILTKWRFFALLMATVLMTVGCSQEDDNEETTQRTSIVNYLQGQQYPYTEVSGVYRTLRLQYWNPPELQLLILQSIRFQQVWVSCITRIAKIWSMRSICLIWSSIGLLPLKRYH